MEPRRPFRGVLRSEEAATGMGASKAWFVVFLLLLVSACPCSVSAGAAERPEAAAGGVSLVCRGWCEGRRIVVEAVLEWTGSVDDVRVERVDWPPLKGARVVGSSSSASVSLDGTLGRRSTLRYRVEAVPEFEGAGEVEVGSVEVAVGGRFGDRRLRSRPFSVRVEAAGGKYLLPGAAMLAGLLLGGALAARRMRRRRRDIAEFDGGRNEGEGVDAERIERLRGLAADPKAFFVEARRCLAACGLLDTPGAAAFREQYELVRFGGYEPDAAEMEEVVASVAGMLWEAVKRDEGRHGCIEREGQAGERLH